MAKTKFYLKKRYFIRMLLVLIILECIRLLLHYLENTLNLNVFSGLILLLLFYYSVVSNKRFLVRLPLQNRHTVLFFVMVLVQIPLQLYVIWFQLRWYFTSGSLPIEVVSLGSYIAKICAQIISFIDGF